MTSTTPPYDSGSTPPYDNGSTAVGGNTEGTAGDERSLGQIVSDVTQDITTLIRQEMDLAKTELKQEVTKAGKGAGLLGGAGVAGYFVLLFLSVTAMYGLAEAMDAWLAALVVTLVWAVVAAVLAMVGKKSLQESNPQLPQTQQTLKEDVQWAKAQKS